MLEGELKVKTQEGIITGKERDSRRLISVKPFKVLGAVVNDHASYNVDTTQSELSFLNPV